MGVWCIFASFRVSSAFYLVVGVFFARFLLVFSRVYVGFVGGFLQDPETYRRWFNLDSHTKNVTMPHIITSSWQCYLIVPCPHKTPASELHPSFFLLQSLYICVCGVCVCLCVCVCVCVCVMFRCSFNIVLIAIIENYQ